MSEWKNLPTSNADNVYKILASGNVSIKDNKDGETVELDPAEFKALVAAVEGTSESDDCCCYCLDDIYAAEINILRARKEGVLDRDRATEMLVELRKLENKAKK